MRGLLSRTLGAIGFWNLDVRMTTGHVDPLVTGNASQQAVRPPNISAVRVKCSPKMGQRP